MSRSIAAASGTIAREHQHLEVVEDVGRLLGEPLVDLARRGARDLVGLLPNLVADPLGIVEELDRVGALGTLALALGQRPLERVQRLVGRAPARRHGGPVDRAVGGPSRSR